MLNIIVIVDAIFLGLKIINDLGSLCIDGVAPGRVGLIVGFDAVAELDKLVDAVVHLVRQPLQSLQTLDLTRAVHAVVQRRNLISLLLFIHVAAAYDLLVLRNLAKGKVALILTR